MASADVAKAKAKATVINNLITAVMAILTGAAPVSASGSVSNAAKY